MHKKILLLALLAGASLAIGSAQASLIASDYFDYPNGDLAGNNGGFGWTGAWANDQNVPQVAGGVAVINSTVGEQGLRTLTLQSSGQVWMAFDAQMFTTGAGETNSYGGFGLFNGGNEVALIGKGWPGTYTWLVGKGGSDRDVSSLSTLDFSSVYARITYVPDGIDFLDVWINPADPTMLNSITPDMTWVPTAPNGDLSFDTIRLRGGVGFSVTESWNFDAVRLGTELSDVVAVPEPSLTALGVLALTAGAAWRRRRRRA